LFANVFPEVVSADLGHSIVDCVGIPYILCLARRGKTPVNFNEANRLNFGPCFASNIGWLVLAKGSVRMPNLKSLSVLAGAAALGALAFSTSPASAVVVDDPQVSVQQTSGPALGGDPNLITNPGSFFATVQGSGQAQNPFIVVVAEYNSIGTPTVSFSGCTIPSACPLLGTGGTPSSLYGFTSSTAPFTSSSSGSLFDQLGTPTNGGSLSFGNLSAHDTANGFAAPSSFELFTFVIPSTLDNTGVNLDTTATPGSFVAAYGCGGTSSGACTGNDVFQTVNTNIGLVVPSPVIGHGLFVLLAVSGVLFGGKLLETLKKRHLQAA
jgi:hypothetical protein